jgi:PAS domain S-box-containing protein
MGRPGAAQDAAAVNESNSKTLVLHGGEPPPWSPRGASDRPLDAGFDAALLQGVSAVLVDGTTTEPLAVARKVRALDAALQVMIVAPAEQRSALELALLFAPGIGEVWIVDASEVGAELLGRAAGITRTRRGYSATRAQLQSAMAGSALAGVGRHTHISDAYLAALLQVLPDPVFSIDDDGCVASWSPSAEQCLGLERGQPKGRSLGDLVRPVDAAALERLLEQGRERPVSGDIRWRRVDDSERAAHITVTPVDAAGQRVRAVLFRDTTEQRESRRQLEEQAIELEAQAEEMTAQRDELAALAAERMSLLDDLRLVAASRSRFYASMSHEIRTPINAILGYNDLLLAGIYGPLNAEQERGLQRAQVAARHLRELVDDVLDLSKIEAGKIDIVSEPVALRRLIDEVVATIGPAAALKGSSIQCTGDEDIQLDTDPRRVRQILLNLLSNAVKFGAGQPVTVRSGRLPADRIFVEVRDHGTGIGSDEIERIFEEFVQLDAPGDEGTGLGLAISRRLAVMLGGSLAVASAPDLGSTFTLMLPTSLPTHTAP